MFIVIITSIWLVLAIVAIYMSWGLIKAFSYFNRIAIRLPDQEKKKLLVSFIPKDKGNIELLLSKYNFDETLKKEFLSRLRKINFIWFLIYFSSIV